MIVGKVGSQIRRSRRQGCDPRLYLDAPGPAGNHPKRDGSIVAAQAKLRLASGLADGRFRRRTVIRGVSGDRAHVVPKRKLAGAAMWCVAKDAYVRFGDGFDCTRTAGRKIVFGGENGFGCPAREARATNY